MTYFEEKFMNHGRLEKMTYGPRWISDGPYVQYLFKFENGYGASVVKGNGTYGHESDRWELALIKWSNDHAWHITQHYKITNDVLGYLSVDEVLDTLDKIKDL